MTSDEAEDGLPEPMAQALAAYERHLVSERDLAGHTVRAYVGDIRVYRFGQSITRLRPPQAYE